MKIYGLLFAVAACGTNPDDGGGDDVVVPPGNLSALEKCVLDGGSLKELWSVGNQHGPVRSIVASSLVVLGSQDGSVKQWSVDGDEPGYGKPFTTAGAPAAGLALSADHIVAATEQGEVAEWKLADASATRTTTIPDAILTVVDVSGDATHVITGTADVGMLVDIERATGAMTQLTTSMWGVDAIRYAAGDRLFTAGHWYGTPQIERRVAAAPVEAADVWNDKDKSGHVRAVAMDAEAKLLFAAGDGFVATFAPDQLAAGPVKYTALPAHFAVGAVLLPGGAYAVTAGHEGALRVWNAKTAEQVGELAIPAPIGVAANSDGTRLYTSGADGRLHAFGCE